MKIDEIKEVEGTEFIYEYEDGDTILAFVKKFNAKIGLTCMTLMTETVRDRWKGQRLEEDGTWCIMSATFKGAKSSNVMEYARRVVEIIKETGHYKQGASGLTNDNNNGIPNCPFR